jgi:hypothetical protein
MPKKSQQQTIMDFEKIHGKKYDYSLVKYESATTKVNIICKTHGLFSITPNSHKNGSGCYKCGRMKVQTSRRLTTEEFISKANQIHGDKYDYSKTNYSNYYGSIIIVCKKHGEFKQQARKHLAGQTCKKCVSESNRFNFVEYVTKNHPQYDYSKVVYKGMYEKVTITCRTHGDFEIKPVNFHHKKRGCKLCLDKNKSRQEEVWLDQIGISSENRNVYISFGKKTYCVDGIDRKKNTIYEYYGDFFHGNPNIYNKDDINPLLKEKYGDLYNKTLEKEEIIKSHGYRLVTMWEKDFVK